jgi:hypothetical protein
VRRSCLPTYSFKDTTTGEVFDKVMKIAEREEYLKENPNIESVVSAPSLMSPISLRGIQPPSGFKEVLKNIHERSPGSQLKKNGNI